MPTPRELPDTSDAAVRALLQAVRAHLWRRESRRAAEFALCASAAVFVGAASIHLLAKPLPLVEALATTAAVWVVAIAWAGARRPRDSDCALWADRHLGGASAFSTWLEVRTRKSAPSTATRCLDAWTRARIPQSLAALARRHEPTRLAQSFAAAAAALVVAALVLALPGGRAAERTNEQEAARIPADQRLASNPNVPASAQSLANELAGALGSRDVPRSQQQSGSDVGTSVARESDAAQDAKGRALGQPGKSNSRSTGSQEANTGLTPHSQAGDVGGATGREAGASRDQRGDPGVSPLPRGTMPLQQVEIAAPTTARDKRAENEERADFEADHTISARENEGAIAVAPAAMPPSNPSIAAGMSPSRAAYVRAWMKALPQAR